MAEAVLTRTLEELATHGFDGLSVERIARAAEVNKTSVYRRWPTREALVAAALEGILQRAAAVSPDTGSLRGDLAALLQPVVELMRKPVGRAVLQAALAPDATTAVASLAARKLARQASDPVKALVERSRARGEWQDGAKGEQVIFMLVGAVMHRVMLEHAPVGPTWLHSLIETVLFGVLPRETRADAKTTPAGSRPRLGGPRARRTR